jgi:hypothetical protein
MSLQDLNEINAAAHIAHRGIVNPQELLLRIVEQYGDDAKKDFLFEKWRKAIRKNDAYQRVVDMYFFINIYNRNFARRRKPPKGPLTEMQKEAIAAQVRRRVARIGLMYLALPSGKLLKESSFQECRNAGGIFAAIGKLGTSNQIVGEVLTEKQLQDLINANH